MKPSTCTKKANGKYEIVVNGEVIRKNSAKAFPFAYAFTTPHGIAIRLSDDGQLNRIYGAPNVISLDQAA